MSSACQVYVSRRMPGGRFSFLVFSEHGVFSLNAQKVPVWRDGKVSAGLPKISFASMFISLSIRYQIRKCFVCVYCHNVSDTSGHGVLAHFG